MLSLIFDVLPMPGQEATYFDTATRLRPALDASGGMLFLDRSRSAARPGWFLSHQYWRDETSMTRWRTNAAHHRAQACGRVDILADYRLCVGQVIAEAMPGESVTRHRLDPAALYDQQPDRSPRLVITAATRQPIAGMPSEAARFASVYEASLEIIIVEVGSILNGETMLAWMAMAPGLMFARLSLLSRDYGMFDRAEAPQHFEPITLA